MLDTERYPSRYTTAEARALYLTAINGYGSIGNMAKDLGLIRTYLPQCFREGIPEKYAGYLGRKWGFSPALLRYEEYLTLTGANSNASPTGYEMLVSTTNFFSLEDKQYILKGKYVKDALKWIRAHDKEVVGNAKLKRAA